MVIGEGICKKAVAFSFEVIFLKANHEKAEDGR
jgi:hypothetical protein